MEAATKSEQQEQKKNGDGNVGTVEEIQGVVIEVAFPDELPEIYNALEVDLERYGEDDETAGRGTLVLEVQQHIGDDRVRAVAMDATDGLARGTKVRDTGGPISVPSARRRSAGSSTCSASPSTRAATSRPRSAGRSIVPRRASRTSRRPARYSRPASRSSTCSLPTRRAGRSACSAAPAWARRCSSRS